MTDGLDIPAALDRRWRDIPTHEYADLFPLLDDEQFDDLVADIQAHGLREPVILYEGAILDGRNRYRACKVAGVDCRFETYEGDDALAYAISKNLKRRHLTESQRGMVAAKLAKLAVGDNQHSEGLPIGRASEMLNVGERTVARAREVQEHGVPELQQAVERGEVSVSAAADVAVLPEEEQREAVAGGEKKIVAKAKETRAKKAKRKRLARRDMNDPAETQHDRDLRMLLGVWEAACESAREAFLEIVVR